MSKYSSVKMVDGKCDGYKQCCSGFRWDEDINSCIKCTDGFVGLNCSEKCPYPGYGEGCQQRCVCSKEQCHYSTGCSQETTLKVQSTILSFPKKSTFRFDVSRVQSTIPSFQEKSTSRQDVSRENQTASLDDTVSLMPSVYFGFGITSASCVAIALLMIYVAVKRCQKRRSCCKREDAFHPNDGDHYQDLLEMNLTAEDDAYSILYDSGFVKHKGNGCISIRQSNSKNTYIIEFETQRKKQHKGNRYCHVPQNLTDADSTLQFKTKNTHQMQRRSI